MNRAIFVSIILVSFIINNDALSWDNGVTHRDLSEYAAYLSVLRDCNNETDQNCDYLKNMGFNKGLDKDSLEWNGNTTIRKGYIKDWIREGAALEDDGSKWQAITGKARFNNHFHNPLKPWTGAGLDDTVVFIPYSGDSSLLWAQNSTKQANALGGDWSWQKIREDFYIALTGKNFTNVEVATTKVERDAYFAKTFRGLGQQMHLMQDAAQPDHVRNDAHPFSINKDGDITIEAWAVKILKTLNDIKAIAPSPQIPGFSLDPSKYTLDQAYYDSTLTPTALFIDTDQYNINNPSQFFTNSLATSQSIGLAEYTNSNFASPETIFNEDLAQTDPHYFPYPNKLSTNLQELISKNILPETVTTEDGVQQPTLYIKKEKDGEIIDHFVKPKYTTTSRQDYIGGKIYELDFYQDEAVYEEYAKLLLPRAVGYSAGLLNYFFRGDIDLISEGGGYVITNNSAEDMEGMFELYQEDSNGVRTRIWNGQLILGPFGSGNHSSGNVSFPGTAGKYMLVFRGRLGNEDDAVVGRVVEILQGELAVFFVDNGDVLRCMTTYANLMNEVPCQSVRSTYGGMSAYGGPEYILAYPGIYFRTTQKAFLHKGKKIYLTNYLSGIGGRKIYLFDPYIKQTYTLGGYAFRDAFMNVSDQHIFIRHRYGEYEVNVFSYDGNGVIINDGTYQPGGWSSYVSPEGDVYKVTNTMIPIETGIPPRPEGYINETKLYTYNIFTEALTELIDQAYLYKSEIHWGGPEYHFALDMMLKSATDGIRAEFQPYIRSISPQYNGQNGWETTYDFTVFGDNYHSINSCDKGGNCSFTGDRVAAIGNRQIYSTLYNSSQGYRSGLLIPYDADIPFTQYEWAVSSADSLQNIIKRISKLITPYEVFESDTEYLEMGNFSVFIEDIIDRNLLIAGFSMKHTDQADPANYYYELVLYNRNGERIDQKLMNILGITNPENLRGIKLLD